MQIAHSVRSSEILCRLFPSIVVAMVGFGVPGAFAGESITPKSVEPPVVQSEDSWQFRLEPYGWATGLDGTMGAKGFDVGFDVGFDKVFENLEFAAAMEFEVRKGRWGLLLDGFYAEIGGGSATPGPLYSTVDAELQQFIGEIAVAYRIWDTDAGFVDLFAGARLNVMTLDITSEISSAGVRNFSEALTEKLVETVSDKVSAAVDERLAGIRGLLPPGLTRSKRNAIVEGARGPLEELVRARADLALASAEAKVVAVKSAVQARVGQAKSRVARAERKLQEAIERELTDRLPTEFDAEESWVDPVVGIRAQVNLSRQIFLAAQADVGGFGVSSELAYQLQATMGCNISRSFFVELGYRYLHTDYESGGFSYDVAQSGAFVGFGFQF